MVHKIFWFKLNLLFQLGLNDKPLSLAKNFILKW